MTDNPSDNGLPFTHEAVRALAAQEAPRALLRLAEAASARDEFIRRTAIETIGRHPQGSNLRGVVLRALQDRSGYVVRTACDVVCEWRLAEAHDAVAALLAASSSYTRQVAIRTLSVIWSETDFPAIFHIYAHSPDMKLRKEAAYALANCAAPAGWQTLFDAFRRDRLPRHRVWACELAGTFAGQDALPALAGLLMDFDGHVRKAAAEAIQNISDSLKPQRNR